MRTLLFLLLSSALFLGVESRAMGQPQRTTQEQKLLDTQLIEAAQSGDNPLVRRLVEQGANINYRGRGCYTPLHFAAANRHHETMELLLELGADVYGMEHLTKKAPKRYPLNAYNRPNCNILQEWEILDQISHQLRLTLCTGKHPRTGNHSIISQLPCHVLHKICTSLKPCSLSHDSTLRAACKARHELNSTFMEAVLAGNINLAQNLLAQGADINAHDVWSRSALSYAVDACNNSLEMTELLLRAHAKRNTGSCHNKHALIHECGNKKSLQLVRAWHRLLGQVRSQCLTLCLAMHPRTGQQASAHILPADAYQKISSYIQVRDLLSDLDEDNDMDENNESDLD